MTSKTDAIVQIRFRVIGQGTLMQLGKGLSLPNSTQIITFPVKDYDETVSYKLRKYKDEWSLADPPLPRFSIKTVRETLKKADHEYASTLKDLGKSHDQKNMNKFIIYIKYNEAEEATINYIDEIHKN